MKSDTPLFAAGARARVVGYRLALAAVPALLLFGCSNVRMAPPADVVAASEPLVVTDRSRSSGALANESFKLGPYQVSGVDRDWDKGSKTGVGPWSKETQTTGYRYKLKGEATDLAGVCKSEAQRQSVVAMGGRYARAWSMLGCHCEGPSGVADLVLSSQGDRLDIDGVTYGVQPVFDTADGNRLLVPTGFRIDHNGPMAAVEIMHPGQVWLSRDLPQAARGRMACVLTGLMLYESPN